MHHIIFLHNQFQNLYFVSGFHVRILTQLVTMLKQIVIWGFNKLILHTVTCINNSVFLIFCAHFLLRILTLTGFIFRKYFSGNGNKRKNRKANDDLKSDDYRSKVDHQCHFKNIESFVAHEEIFLNGVFGVLCQVSILINIKSNKRDFVKSCILCCFCESF